MQIPANLNLWKVIHESQLEHLRHNHHYYLYVVDLIGEVASQVDWGDDAELWVPVNATRLRQQISARNVPLVLDNLVEAGVLELRDAKPAANISAKQFRLAEKYRLAETIEIVPPQKTVNRKLEERAKEQRRPQNEIQVILNGWLDRVEIDGAKARAAVRLVKEDNALVTSLNAIARLENCKLFFKPDKNGRVHTNISSLSRAAREFLSVDGERLANVDIACSQPLILMMLHRKYVKLCNKIKKSNMNESVISYVDTNYESLVESGELYEYLMRQTGKLDRGKVKKQFVAALFDDVTYPTFLRFFPSLFLFVRQFKYENRPNGGAALAKRLQGIESNLILDRVCGRLAAERPEIALLTIHDSLLVPPRHAESVAAVIQEEARKLDISPTIKIDGLEFKRDNGRSSKAS